MTTSSHGVLLTVISSPRTAKGNIPVSMRSSGGPSWNTLIGPGGSSMPNPQSSEFTRYISSITTAEPQGATVRKCTGTSLAVNSSTCVVEDALSATGLWVEKA